MKLLIDALSARQGGGQTYLANLIGAFPNLPGDKIFLLVPPTFNLPVKRPGLHPIEVSRIVETPVARAAWERLFLPRLINKLGVEVLFCPGGIIPSGIPGNCRTATMFRNMIPFDKAQRARYPLGYTRLRNYLLEHLFLSSMAAADLVIFISEYARELIETRAPEGVRRSAVIPHGLADHFRTGSSQSARPRWLPEGDYLLYVSSIDRYKAQLEVVRGYGILQARRGGLPYLVLTGPVNDSGYERVLRGEVERLGLKESVLFTGSVAYADLPAAYQHAVVNIFASESENCPNILLEAMASGRAVISSCFPPMPEFGGDAVEYFDPRNPSDLAEKLGALLDSPRRMTELADRAQRHTQKFNWVTTAKRTRQALADLVGTPDHG